MYNDDDDDHNYDIDSWRQLPVFIQAEVILKLVERIVDCIPKEDSNASSEYEYALFDYHTNNMIENALIIPAKIAGIHGVELYDIKMENAVIIRKAAHEIILNLRGLQIAGFKEIEYLDLLRKEIEVLRPLFAVWVSTFNPYNYIIDRWGLFNPPGVHYNDKMPEDDLPYDSNHSHDDFDSEED
ncbi:hypothetical protein [uncultured Dokdonia sp.]|uniref:hypothetical protein n=1 Tax=uncultured Dokdonia sp. TaxID=575653 RepID=UPI002618FD73|nr:hypothetical protein [uncultured Dokdonia sp.]